MITMPLDKFHALIDAYVKIHGGSIKNILCDTAFLISNDGPTFNWKAIVGNNMRIVQNGQVPDINPDGYMQYNSLASGIQNPLR